MIKNILITILAGVLLCGWSGCPDNTVRENPSQPAAEKKVATNVEAPTQTQTPEQQKVTSLEKQLEAANKKADEATARGDLIAKLTAEKDALVIREQISISNAKQWEANAVAYHSQASDKDVEIKNAKIEAWKERLWIMSAICGLLAIIAGGIAIGFPLLRPVAWKAGAVLGAIASLMLIVAQCLATVSWLLGLVPYILGIGAAVGLFYGAVALRHWFKDHTSLKQVVTAVEPIKNQVKDFGSHMMKYVDTPMETHITEMRTKLGLKKVIDPQVESELDALRKALADKEAELAAKVTAEVAKVEKSI
jgi:hypothetical protein